MKDNFWRRREGQPRLGRFIKGTDPLVSSLSLTDFSFREICESPYVETDNVKRSLIRPSLHEDIVIEDGVRPSEILSKELRPQEAIRPVLRPLDFTSDWENQKARATARRQSRMDDEDEFDVELELQKQQFRPSKKGKAGKAASEAVQPIVEKEPEPVTLTQAPNENVEIPVPTVDTAARAKRPEEISLHEDNRRKFRAQTDTMDKIGKEINRLSTTTQDKPGVPLQLEREVQPETKATEADKEFIPFAADAADSPRPEHLAVDQYKLQQVEIQKAYQDELNKAFEEAKASGFAAGYQFGEEKAGIQMRSHNIQLANSLDAAVKQIDQLKAGLIANTEHNFREALHAIAEVLIRREFSLDPKSLSGVIKQAISDGIDGDQIKIFVHPDTFDLLNKSGANDFSGKLIRDEQMPPGEFRIESSLSVVDGRISDLVKDMIAQADVHLVDKAG